MHDLTPLTALGGTRPKQDWIGSLTITEVPDVALASVAALRGSEKPTAAGLKKLINAAAPGPGKAAGGDILALWTGPEQWMLMAAIPAHELLADVAAQALQGKASITEQSGAWVRFDIEGAAVFDLFERLCALPVRRMQTGDAERTRIEHLAVFVICHGERFSVLGAGSSAGSLHHALLSAAQSVA